MPLQLAKPISTVVTSTGTKIEKAASKGKNLLLTNGTYLRTGGQGTLSKLITFGPNSTSKFKQAGADQVLAVYTPGRPWQGKFLAFFKEGKLLGGLTIRQGVAEKEGLYGDFLKKSGLLEKFKEIPGW